MNAMNIVFLICAIMLGAGAVITLFRVLRGPSSLDRLVGVDCLAGVMMCGLSVWAAYSLDSTVVAAVLALSLIGFVGSISVARFRVRDK